MEKYIYIKNKTVAILKKKKKVYKQLMPERIWRKGNPLTLLVGM